MRIQLDKGDMLNIEIGITNDNKKHVNLDKYSCQDLINILQELTDEFQGKQEEIEMILENKNPSGKCYYNGELLPWDEHIRNYVSPRN